MLRRAFVLLPLMLAALPAMAVLRHSPDLLRRAFDRLDPAARRAVQGELATAGLYPGPIDGAYGPGTEWALVLAADHVAANSRGQVRFDLTSGAAIGGYVDDLASGRLAKWLYGEGDECDGC